MGVCSVRPRTSATLPFCRPVRFPRLVTQELKRVPVTLAVGGKPGRRTRVAHPHPLSQGHTQGRIFFGLRCWLSMTLRELSPPLAWLQLEPHALAS